ncbi:unnamed protein product, partial [Prorocentrum cordatum]
HDYFMMVNAMLEFREAVTELGAIINDKLVIVGTTLSLAQGIAPRRAKRKVHMLRRMRKIRPFGKAITGHKAQSIGRVIRAGALPEATCGSEVVGLSNSESP